MKVGIIAEFDPFHNGHLKIVSEARRLGDVTVALSGNITQRGVPSFMPKTARVSAALSGGADLVIENPSFFSSSSAEGFARAGVKLLSEVGIDMLVFGSECGDEALIEKAVDDCEKVKDAIALKVESGLGYAAARETALRENGFISSADLLKNSNDILGFEYVRAIRDLAPNIMPKAIKRTVRRGDISDCFASSSDIRNDVESGFRFMPGFSFDLLTDAVKNGEVADIKRAERTVLNFWRTADTRSLEEIAEAGEGICYRLASAAADSTDFDGFIKNAAAKRYTNARLVRAAVGGFLGKKAVSKEVLPPYIRILGADEKGFEIVKSAKSSSLPIISKSSECLKLGGFATSCFEYEIRASELRNLCLESYFPAGSELRFSPILPR